MEKNTPLLCCNFKILFSALCLLFIPGVTNAKIDRKAVVDRHQISITKTNTTSPSQVGNGKFAFGVDITGLQTFTTFNTMSDWGWHSFPLPNNLDPDDFEQLPLNTHGRNVLYDLPNPNQPELTGWLASNPHRANLGRIGFSLKLENGKEAYQFNLKNKTQYVDLWTGIVHSSFTLQGKTVNVKTMCHPELDLIGVSIDSDLMQEGRLSIFFDFPYQDDRQMTDYVGNYDNPSNHISIRKNSSGSGARIIREMDDLNYFVDINWESSAVFCRETDSNHRFYLHPNKTAQFSFSCLFDRNKNRVNNILVDNIEKASVSSWEEYWQSGAAIDLSQSSDSRWKELERRIVLSQYLMKINESGLYPPQEAGLVNNGWYGRFHFEMIWWHGVHYALWNRWNMVEKYLNIYQNFLPTSKVRAQKQGYKGARWPKCTADFDREWPDNTHATLIWQQPHPIYFAEQDYRLHPTQETLNKWKDVVFETANFMADFAFYSSGKGTYVLGPPMTIVSENTNFRTTQNPTFELSYWRYGLRTALEWCKRLSVEEPEKWKDVLAKLSPLPVENNLYVTHEGIQDMWTKYTYEHPALIGVYGMLPGDGVDKDIFVKTLNKVVSTWNFNATWGWDFPMVAMAAARSGNEELAINMLLHSSSGFQFDEHGLCTGGPFPYFPANGGLLTTIAMMCGGWDGSTGDNPGFPKNGNWTVISENFNLMQ